MPKKFFVVTSVLCAVAFLLSGQRPPRAPSRRVATAGPQGMLRDAVLENRVRAALGSAPLRFEENVGQADSPVKFVARGSNFMLALTPQEAALRFHTPHVREKRPPQLDPEGQGWADARGAASIVRVEFAASNPTARLAGLDAQPGTINYIKGNDPSRWRRNVPHYSRVRYEGLYPGIDAVFYGDRRQMEFDFVVAPGADPSAIRMRVEGAGSLELTESGGVEARTSAGIVTLLPPRLYQRIDGAKPEVAGRYVWRAPGELGFEVAPYDRRQALVIDPAANVNQAGGKPRPQFRAPPDSAPPTGGSVALSTQLGGIQDDSIQAIAIGSTAGHVYVAGFTDSTLFYNFPMVGAGAAGQGPGGTPFFSCQVPQSPCGDAFVAEFDVSTITAPVLVTTTYLGGSNDDVAWSLALDNSDDPYLIGQTDSLDFPTTANALQTPTGGTLGFPVTNSGCGTPAQPRACHHVFFSVLSSDLSTLIYSTYLAGSDDDEGYAVAVDGSGNAFLTGIAGEFFPTTTPSFQNFYNGAGDAFVGEIFNPACTTGCANPPGTLKYLTYVGGFETDAGLAIAVDGNDNAYVGGVTFSTTDNSFANTGAITSGALQTTSNDAATCGPGAVFTCGDGFVFVLNAAGTSVSYGTFLGGSSADQVNAIAIDTSNNVYATGETRSGDFQPVTSYGTGKFQTSLSGGYDAFVVKFSPSADAGAFYATYLGGQNDDIGLGIALDGSGDAFITGSTASGIDSGFPLTNKGGTAIALQTQTNAGSFNPTSFVSVLNPAGTDLLFSTYYGGLNNFFSLFNPGNFPTDVGSAIALDSNGRIYLAGRTTSYTTPDNSNPLGLCLINPVPSALNESGQFTADYNGFLTIINPTSSASACFSPSLTVPIPLTFTFSPILQNMTNPNAQVLTIFNQGSAALTNTISFGGSNTTDFPETDNCATVNGGGASCQISVKFKPTAATGAVSVAETATLIISNNANCPASTPCTVSLRGTGLPLATVTLAPAPPTSGTNPFAFPGTTAVGSTSAAQQFLLTNTSTTSPVDITSVALGGTNPGEFTITSDFCTGIQVSAGGNCSILVAFKPTTTPPGARTATLTVMDDGTTNPSFGLSGTSVLPPPNASIPPLSLTFGPQVQGTTSAAQMVTITNDAAAGSANLTVTQPLTFTGANAADFTATGCTTAVPPAGGNCTLSVTFKPGAAGTNPRMATLQIVDNATNSPQTINVSGTELPLPTITLSPNPPAALTFPAQVLGTTSAPMFVTLTNTSATSPVSITGVALSGGNSGEFGITNGCGSSLAAGANCIVSVTFSPAAPTVGARTTTLQFTDNASDTPASPQNVTINGTGVAAPTLTPQPMLTFAGTQPLNTPTTLAATLTNPNTVALSISSITASGDFSVASNTCGVSLGANSPCTINVTFTPTAAGARTGTLTVIDNFGAATLTQTTNLTGTGATPATANLALSTSPGTPLVTSPGAPLGFGTQAVGVTSSVTSVILTNTGGSPLNISAIAPTGDFAEMDNCLPSVAANGGMCSINITFTPSGVGTRNGSIVIVDNAAGGSQTIYLSGTGSSNVPGFNLSAPLFFGAVLVGSTSATQTITITNSGGAPLTIMSATASAQFGVPTNTCTTVPVGQNCMIGVNFTPNATGTQTGTLTIMDNAPGNPHSVSLSGIGAMVNIVPPPGGQASASVIPGDTAQYPLNVTGTPGLVITLDLSCTSTAPYTRCSVSPSPVTVGGATPPLITVTVLTNCNPALVYRPVGGSPPILPAPFAGLWVGTLALFVLLRRVAPRPWLARAAPALLLILLVVTWAGCINNPPPAIPGAPTTPAGNYAVTVTAINPITGKAVINPPLTLTLRVI